MATPQVTIEGTGNLDTKLLLTTLMAVRKGDFSFRLPVNWTGINGKIADAFNDIIELNQKMARELEGLSLMVGKEGKISQAISLDIAGGSWAKMVDSINSLGVLTGIKKLDKINFKMVESDISIFSSKNGWFFLMRK